MQKERDPQTHKIFIDHFGVDVVVHGWKAHESEKNYATKPHDMNVVYTQIQMLNPKNNKTPCSSKNLNIQNVRWQILPWHTHKYTHLDNKQSSIEDTKQAKETHKMQERHGENM